MTHRLPSRDVIKHPLLMLLILLNMGGERVRAGRRFAAVFAKPSRNLLIYAIKYCDIFKK